MKPLFLILLLGLYIQAQQHSWIVYFIKDGWTYEFDPVPAGEIGTARNVHLKSGDVVITEVQYICSSKEVAPIDELYYDSNGNFLGRSKLEHNWVKHSKKSTIDKGLN